ncbi:hypothetical protein CH263_19960 [Rhodococcus sp. 06-1059B-a]|nr:hypothetical protein CH263_19960 [Rhodococcus sp. 06-1059B-a]
MRLLVDTPAARIVLDAAGAVSMFVVLAAIAGSRDAALVTAALTAVVLTSRIHRRAAAHRPYYPRRGPVAPAFTPTARAMHTRTTDPAVHVRTGDTHHGPPENPPLQG